MTFYKQNVLGSISAFADNKCIFYFELLMNISEISEKFCYGFLLFRYWCLTNIFVMHLMYNSDDVYSKYKCINKFSFENCWIYTE